MKENHAGFGETRGLREGSPSKGSGPRGLPLNMNLRSESEIRVRQMSATSSNGTLPAGRVEELECHQKKHRKPLEAFRSCLKRKNLPRWGWPSGFPFSTELALTPTAANSAPYIGETSLVLIAWLQPPLTKNLSCSIIPNVSDTAAYLGGGANRGTLKKQVSS